MVSTVVDCLLFVCADAVDTINDNDNVNVNANDNLNLNANDNVNLNANGNANLNANGNANNPSSFILHLSFQFHFTPVCP